jgi:hypothetical protein
MYGWIYLPALGRLPVPVSMMNDAATGLLRCERVSGQPETFVVHLSGVVRLLNSRLESIVARVVTQQPTQLPHPSNRRGEVRADKAQCTLVGPPIVSPRPGQLRCNRADYPQESAGKSKERLGHIILPSSRTSRDSSR